MSDFPWSEFDDPDVGNISADGMTLRATRLINYGLHVLGEEFMAEHVKEVFFHRDTNPDSPTPGIVVLITTCQHIKADDVNVMNAIQKVVAGLFRAGKWSVTFDEGALKLGRVGWPISMDVYFATEIKDEEAMEKMVAEFMGEVEATLGPSAPEPRPSDPNDPMSRWM